MSSTTTIPTVLRHAREIVEKPLKLCREQIAHRQEYPHKLAQLDRR